MSLSLFQQRTCKGPFIGTQRLLYLDAPPEKRRQCLEPGRFREARQRKRSRHEPGEIKMPPKCRWRRVKDRAKFLARTRRSGGPRSATQDSAAHPQNAARGQRLCVLIDAGVGKTTAMQQIQYLRSVALDGHLAMGFKFSELPNEAARYLDQGGDSWLPHRFGDAEKDLPVDQARELILRKIRQGEFTLLVDALDQSRAISGGNRDPFEVAAALCRFLRRYPKVHCVVSGRPYAITRYWEQLFADDDWDFLQIDFFTPAEQEEYVGPDKWSVMQRLEADVIAVPRMLETVRGLASDELRGVRTGADLYWRALDDALNKAFAGQDLSITRSDAEKLFALIAIEFVHRPGNFEGVESGAFSSFVFDLCEKRSREPEKLLEEYRDLDRLKKKIQELGRVNEVLDFAVMEDTGDQQLFFRDQTLRDFFAALWMSRYASQDDRNWLLDHLHQWGLWGEHAAHEELYPFWRLLTEMPVSAWQPHSAWVASMAGLFLPLDAARQVVRSTEMMYRAWWGLMHVAGKLKAAVSERKMLRVTERLQRHVYACVRDKTLAFEPHGTMPGTAKEAAWHVIEQFLAEFPAVRFGHIRPADAKATEIAAEFDANWFPTVIPHGEFLMGGLHAVGDEPEHVGSIPTAYQMAKFPVTNELYRLFDPVNAGRFTEYKQYSADPRCPAIYITWFDAWCAALWLHARLPDEYEWERACRGAKAPLERKAWWYGGDENKLGRYAWYAANSDTRTHPVDEADEHGRLLKEPNDLGLFHMHGQVWEWTSSWYADDPRTGRRPTFTGSSRVLRGGSWGSGAEYCRCAYRSHFTPELTGSNVGFRVCRSSCRS